MRLIICGGREYELTHDDFVALDTLRESVELVIHGNARGADKGGERWALSRGIPVTSMAARWDLYGRRAGYIRNVAMAEYVGHDGAVVAFPGGKGTAMMVRIAKQLGIAMYDWRDPDWLAGRSTT